MHTSLEASSGLCRTSAYDRVMHTAPAVSTEVDSICGIRFVFTLLLVLFLC